MYLWRHNPGTFVGGIKKNLDILNKDSRGENMAPTEWTQDFGYKAWEIYIYRYRRKSSDKMDVGKTGYGNVDWINLALGLETTRFLSCQQTT